METKELIAKEKLDEEKIARLEKIGIVGLDHLIQYLQVKDDKDFLDLAKEVHQLLIGLYHISKEEEKYLEVLGAKSKEESVERMESVIDRLASQIDLDVKLIRNKKEINYESLVALIQQFKKVIDDLLTKNF